MKLPIMKLPIMAFLCILFIAGCNDEQEPQKPTTIDSTSPASSATGVERNKLIAVTFSNEMDPLSINSSTFTLMDGTTPIVGVIAYSGKTATFASTILLEANTTFTAKITNGVKGVDGTPLSTGTTWNFTTSGISLGQAGVDLGTSIEYVILAKTAINNNPTSAITGNLGLSPAATSYITGFDLTNSTGYATASQVTGKLYAADMASPTSINLTTAVNNMIAAYNDLAGRPTPDFSELGTGNIGGKTLLPGLYKWTSTVTIPSNITISGGANDIWIFQIAGNLTQSSGVNITLSGGAQAKNIFWQVADEVTIGTTAHFEGIILAKKGITFATGASMNGRALAQTAVILDGNTLVNP